MSASGSSIPASVAWRIAHILFPRVQDVHHQVCSAASSEQPPARAPEPPSPSQQQQQQQQQHRDALNTRPVTGGLLARFAPSPERIAAGRITRRAGGRPKGGTTEWSTLEAYLPFLPHKEAPKSLTELYSVTLPQLRSYLRRRGLRQVGHLRDAPLEEATAEVLDEAAIRLLEPRVWTAPAPPDADALPYNPQERIRVRLSMLDRYRYRLQVETDVPVPMLRVHLVTVATGGGAQRPRPISRFTRTLVQLEAGERRIVEGHLRLDVPDGQRSIKYTVQAEVFLVLPDGNVRIATLDPIPIPDP